MKTAKSLQLFPTLCDPTDGSPPGSPIPGILQARTLEWVAISFSNAWKWKVKVKSLSRIQLLATPWTAAYQAPLCMGFSRQEYWSGVPLPSPRIWKIPINLTFTIFNSLSYHFDICQHCKCWVQEQAFRLKSKYCHLFAAWPWTTHMSSLCLNSLIYKWEEC